MILVTGATGKVGSEVVRQLAAAGAQVRAFVRDPEKAKAKLGGVELAAGDLARPETLAAALRGVEKLYLLPPLVPTMTELEALAIEQARRAGVKHVVKHSNMGAQHEPGLTLPRWHRAGEKRIEASGMAWTFVRPTGFMSNALAWAGSIKSQGVVYGNGGDGKMSVVDPRDIAAVAVKALTEPGHENKAYSITGPEALSQAQIAEKLSAATGKPIQYVDLPPETAREGMLKAGLPPRLVEGLSQLVGAVRAGRMTGATPELERLLGRKPRTFDEWARENAAAFQ